MGVKNFDTEMELNYHSAEPCIKLVKLRVLWAELQRSEFNKPMIIGTGGIYSHKRFIETSCSIRGITCTVGNKIR